MELCKNKIQIEILSNLKHCYYRLKTKQKKLIRLRLRQYFNNIHTFGNLHEIDNQIVSGN